MRKWMIWSTSSALYVLVNFHRFAMGVISDQLMAALAIAAVGLGGLSSLYFYLYAVLQVPAGILADTWGPRRTITASAVIMAAGSFVFGVARDLTWIGPATDLLPASRLGLYSFAFGVFGSSLLLCLSCVKEQQPERVGVAIAAVNAGGFLGAAVLQILLGFVLDFYCIHPWPSPGPSASVCC